MLSNICFFLMCGSKKINLHKHIILFTMVMSDWLLSSRKTLWHNKHHLKFKRLIVFLSPTPPQNSCCSSATWMTLSRHSLDYRTHNIYLSAGSPSNESINVCLQEGFNDSLLNPTESTPNTQDSNHMNLEQKHTQPGISSNIYNGDLHFILVCYTVNIPRNHLSNEDHMQYLHTVQGQTFQLMQAYCACYFPNCKHMH